MRTSNSANQALRHADVGHVWEEKLSGAMGTLILKTHQTFRVHAAAGGVTVTMDGILAATLNNNGDELIFNSGPGAPQPAGSPPATKVVVVIAGGNAYVQVARENSREI